MAENISIEDLTHRERLIYAMCLRFPQAKEYKISKLIKTNPSTFSIVKNRLIKEGYMMPLYLPDIRYIGIDVISVVFNTNSISRMLYNLKNNTNNSMVLNEQAKNWLFGIFTPSKYIVVSLFRDCVEAKMKRDLYYRMCIDNKTTNQIKGIKYIVMLSQLLEIYNIYLQNEFLVYAFEDYIKDIALHYDLVEHVTEKNRGKEMPLNIQQLNERQRAALRCLLQHPMPSDEEVAEHTGLSRISVYRLKTSLLESGILKKVYFPNMRALGMQTVALTHTYMNTKMHDIFVAWHNLKFKGKVEPEASELIRKIMTTNIIMFGDSIDLVMFNVFKNYYDARQFEDYMSQLHALCDNDGMRPEIFTMALRNVHMYYPKSFPDVL